MNLTQIMLAAWRHYRAYRATAYAANAPHSQLLRVCLQTAWRDARNKAEQAQISADLAAARAAYVPPTARLTQIDEQLQAMELRNFIDWPTFNALKAERGALNENR